MSLLIAGSRQSLQRSIHIVSAVAFQPTALREGDSL